MCVTFPHALQWCRLLVKENLEPHFMQAGAWESGIHCGAVVPRELHRCTGKAPREPFRPVKSTTGVSTTLFLRSVHESSAGSECSVLSVWCPVSSRGDPERPKTASRCSCSFSARSFSSMTESSFRPGLSLRSSNRDSLESFRVEYPKRLSPHTDRVAVTACLIVSVVGAQSLWFILQPPLSFMLPSDQHNTDLPNDESDVSSQKPRDCHDSTSLSLKG